MLGTWEEGMRGLGRLKCAFPGVSGPGKDGDRALGTEELGLRIDGKTVCG